jgi:putative SOS response-associated peptidase YedK
VCGRFTLTLPPEALAEIFGVDGVPPIPRRFNIAPTDEVPIIKPKSGRREAALARWGLIPSGAKDASSGPRMINARQETLFEKQPFASAARSRRCLVPSDGFFEWKALDAKRKQPFRIGLDGGGVFAMAGLWDTWRAPDGRSIVSCTVLTTRPNGLVEPIHDRMPVILDENDWQLWLDLSIKDREPLERLFEPFDARRMRMQPVSMRVNDVKNDDAGCIEVVEEPKPESAPPKKQLGFDF